MDDLLDNKLKEFSNKFDLGAIDFSKYTAGRTSFQLERFVMQEHDLPERKFLQLMMELKSMRDGFIGDCFDIEKLKIEIKRLQLKNDEIDNLEACKKQYILRQHEENMIFREREIKTIVKLINSLPKIYTYDEIEAAESRYWECRLTRQAFEDMASAQTGINQGNIRANIQAGTTMAPNLLDFKQSLLNNFINPQITYTSK
jgi:hypothetical protein